MVEWTYLSGDLYDFIIPVFSSSLIFRSSKNNKEGKITLVVTKSTESSKEEWID